MRKQGSCLKKRDNAWNNARCTQAKKATHGLDGQHQDVGRTGREIVSQDDRGQRQMEKVRPWCGQGRLKNRTERVIFQVALQAREMSPLNCSTLIRQRTIVVPIQLALCWFPGLDISNAKI